MANIEQPDNGSVYQVDAISLDQFLETLFQFPFNS